MKEQVLKCLAENGEAMSAGQIAKKLEVEQKIVDKAMKELKAEEKIISPKRCYWTNAN